MPADDAARLLKLLTARWDGGKRALPAARRKVVEDIRNTMLQGARGAVVGGAELAKKSVPPREYGGIAVGSSMTGVEDVLASGNLFGAETTEPDEGVDPERLGRQRGPLLGREAVPRGRARELLTLAMHLGSGHSSAATVTLRRRKRGPCRRARSTRFKLSRQLYAKPFVHQPTLNSHRLLLHRGRMKKRRDDER